MTGQEDAVRRGAEARLRELGERLTPARRELIAVLSATSEHLSAEEVFERVAERSERPPSRATIYRALATLGELGVVRHTHLAGASTVYHVGAAEPHAAHAHLQCERCGRVIDVPSEHLAGFVTLAAQRWGFAVDAAHAALLGTCAGCRAEDARASAPGT